MSKPPRLAKRRNAATTRRVASASSPPWVHLGVLSVAALAVRLCYVVSIRHAYFFDHLQTEPLRYQRWATLIVNGRMPLPPFDEAPAYPFFVAAMYALCGASQFPIAVVQAVLDAAGCLLIGLIGRRWFGARAGLIAGALAAAYGPFIYFTGELLPTTLSLFVLLAAVASALAPWREETADKHRARASRRPRKHGASSARTEIFHQVDLPTVRPEEPPVSASVSKGVLAKRSTVSDPGAGAPQEAVPSWLLSGGLWAAALLVRVENALALPFVFLDAWWRGGRRGLARVAAPVVLVILIWTAANAAFSHELVIATTGSGINLWLGNNPHSDAVNPFIFGPLERVATEMRSRATNAVQWDGLFRRQAMAFLRDQPGQALALLWKKFVWTWVDRELPNTSDVEWQTAQSWIYWPPVFPLSFGLIFPLAGAGVFFLGHPWRRVVLLAGFPAIALGTCLIFFTNGRFRVIMAPAMLWLAAVALDRIPQALRSWRANWGQLLAAAGGSVLAAIAAWGNFYEVRTYRIPQIAVNIGVLEREAGQLDAALGHLREGLAGDPHDGLAWVHLALALEQRGEVDAALQAYLDALEQEPADPTLRQMASRFFQRHHLEPGLLQTYLQASTPAARQGIRHEAQQRLSNRPP
jgi:tetratricopeptide repeat protein/dolichyl-phosphate-mannose-protein mannosyltransferase